MGGVCMREEKKEGGRGEVLVKLFPLVSKEAKSLSATSCTKIKEEGYSIRATHLLQPCSSV